MIRITTEVKSLEKKIDHQHQIIDSLEKTRDNHAKSAAESAETVSNTADSLLTLVCCLNIDLCVMSVIIFFTQ